MTVMIDTLFSQRQRDQLSKDIPTPLYYQLYSLLKACILDGTLSYNERMPTEEQLAETFKVSRITAKRAMDELANENLVERRRGRGTHITYQYTPKPVQAPLVGMLQEIESMARNSQAILVECNMKQPPQAIRDELSLNAGDTALHLIRVRERSDLKFGYYESWTIGVDTPKDHNLFVATPRLAYFRENGLEVTHVTQTLSAVAAPQHVAAALEIEVNSPLLCLIRRSYNKVNNQEQLMDYLHVLYHPERFQYQMDLKIE